MTSKFGTYCGISNQHDGLPTNYSTTWEDVTCENKEKPSEENMKECDDGPIQSDNWEHKSEKMICYTCMWHSNGRCRKHSPTLNGYPAVYPTDWCGDYKINKEDMN